MWISRSPPNLQKWFGGKYVIIILFISLNFNFIALKITQEFWVVSHLRGRNKFVKSLNVLKFITEIWYDMII